jgi:hypothetical protein
VAHVQLFASPEIEALLDEEEADIPFNYFLAAAFLTALRAIIPVRRDTWLGGPASTRSRVARSRPCWWQATQRGDDHCFLRPALGSDRR